MLKKLTFVFGMIGITENAISSTNTPCSSLIGYGILGKSIESAPMPPSPISSPDTSPSTSPFRSGFLSSHTETREPAPSTLQISHTISEDSTVDESEEELPDLEHLPPGFVAHPSLSKTADSADTYKNFSALKFLKEKQADISTLSSRAYDLSGVQRALEHLSKKINLFPTHMLMTQQLRDEKQRIHRLFQIVCGKFLDTYKLLEFWKNAISAEKKEFFVSEIQKLRDWAARKEVGVPSPKCVLVLYSQSMSCQKIALRFFDFDPAYLEANKIIYLWPESERKKHLSQEIYVQRLKQLNISEEDITIVTKIPESVKMPQGSFKNKAGALTYAQRSEDVLSKIGLEEDFIEQLDVSYSEFFQNFAAFRNEWKQFISRIEQSRLVSFGAVGAMYSPISYLEEIPFSPPLDFLSSASRGTSTVSKSVMGRSVTGYVDKAPIREIRGKDSPEKTSPRADSSLSSAPPSS